MAWSARSRRLATCDTELVEVSQGESNSRPGSVSINWIELNWQRQEIKTYRRSLGNGRPGRDGGATSKDLEGSLLAGEVSGGCSESGQHGDWRCKRQREDRGQTEEQSRM